MGKFLKRLGLEETAQDVSEYALLMVLLVLTALVGIKGFVSTTKNVYSSASMHTSAAVAHQSISTDAVPDNNTIHTKGPSNSRTTP